LLDLNNYLLVEYIFFYNSILKGNNSFKTFVSADGRWVLTTSGKHNIRIWQRTGMRLIPIQLWDKLNGGIRCAVFSTDGQRILTGSADHVLRLWTIKGDMFTFPVQKDTITSVVFSPKGQQYLTVLQNGTIQIWKSDTSFLKLNGTGITSAAFFSDGDFILTGSQERILQIWNLNGVLKTSFGHMGQINSVAVSQNWEDAIAGSLDKTAQVWALKFNNLKFNHNVEATLGHNTPLNLVRFSPDNKQAIVAGNNGNVRIWIKTELQDNQDKNVENWSMQNELKGINYRVGSIGFSPDGDTVITARSNGSVQLWAIHKQGSNKDRLAQQKTLVDFLRSGAIDSFSSREMDSLCTCLIYVDRKLSKNGQLCIQKVKSPFDKEGYSVNH